MASETRQAFLIELTPPVLLVPDVIHAQDKVTAALGTPLHIDWVPDASITAYTQPAPHLALLIHSPLRTYRPNLTHSISSRPSTTHITEMATTQPTYGATTNTAAPAAANGGYATTGAAPVAPTKTAVSPTHDVLLYFLAL